MQTFTEFREGKDTSDLDVLVLDYAIYLADQRLKSYNDLIERNNLLIVSVKEPKVKDSIEKQTQELQSFEYGVLHLKKEVEDLRESILIKDKS